MRMATRVVATSLMMVAIAVNVPREAEAQLASCSMGVSSVSFGNYNPLSLTSQDVTGTVTFTCNVFALVPRLSLNRGASPTFNPRTMIGPSSAVLNYNLYLDATHLLIWGDGTSGTSQFVAVGLAGSVTYFGSIPARQNARAGAYNDSLTVTIIF
jgi:spore coat protein U-like protein